MMNQPMIINDASDDDEKFVSVFFLMWRLKIGLRYENWSKDGISERLK